MSRLLGGYPRTGVAVRPWLALLTVDEAAWISLVRAALGSRGVAQFHAMMDGKLVLPRSDAFGPQDAIQADQKATLTLLIERNGKTSPITYLPRGATVSAYQWKRRLGVPDRDCRI